MVVTSQYLFVNVSLQLILTEAESITFGHYIHYIIVYSRWTTQGCEKILLPECWRIFGVPAR